MRYNIKFKEITEKIVEIDADSLEKALSIADEMLENISEINFEKNPDYYDVFVDNIEEVKL